MSQPNPGRWVKIKRFYHQHPGRCLMAVIALVAAIWLLLKHEYLLALITFNVVVQALTSHKIKNQQYPAVFVPDVLAELKLERNMLHVKHRQLPLHNIRKVVLDQVDEQQAIIDFPFNVYGKLAMRFPASQLPALQDWVKQHLPHTQIIR